MDFLTGSNIRAGCLILKLQLQPFGPLRTALACERYRLTTGDWPDNLSKLVPDFLSALPTDPFDGQTIRFERIEQGVKIWSIGEDQTDDSGYVGQNAPDAGWILLDPGQRGRPRGNNGAP